MDSTQAHSALSGPGMNDWDNRSLLSSISAHFHSYFILNENYSLLITQVELKKLLLGQKRYELNLGKSNRMSDNNM